MRRVIGEEGDLRGGRLGDAVADVAQVAQVLLSVLVDFGDLLATRAATGHEADRAHDHHQRHHQHVRGQLPHPGEQHDGDHPEHAAAHHVGQGLLQARRRNLDTQVIGR